MGDPLIDTRFTRSQRFYPTSLFIFNMKMSMGATIGNRSRPNDNDVEKLLVQKMGDDIKPFWFNVFPMAFLFILDTLVLSMNISKINLTY
jgi:hypothetical protein